MTDDTQPTGEFLLYTTGDGKSRVECRFENETKSRRGTQFRKWANTRLQEYLIKGFSMDDERLKNPPVDGNGIPIRRVPTQGERSRNEPLISLMIQIPIL